MEKEINFGIKQQYINKMRTVFARYPQVEEVILYGSRAMGNYHYGSDIDLTMLGKTLNQSIKFKIENELEDLLLPHKIDLSIYYRIENKALLEHINQAGKSFYRKGDLKPTNSKQFAET